MKKKQTGSKPDFTILIFAASMIIFGIIMVFDSSVFVANQPPFSDPFHFLRLHSLWVLIGIIPSVLIYLWDYRKFSKLIIPALIVNIIMLVLVLFSDNEVNGSQRWLRLGSDQLVLQPAELIKPIFIIYIATWLAKERPYYKNFKDALKLGFGQKLVGFSLTLGLILLLIVLEPDLGTTLVIGTTAFAIFLVSGTDFAHLLGSFFVTGVFGLMAGIAAILAPYRLKRVQTYIHLFFTGQVDDPQGRGYQIQQILIGIGSGGFWGKGFGQSRQRSGYLVELTAFTDSIFAVILEELGMLGGIIFIIAWILFLRAGLKVARNAPDRQGKLIAVGVTVWLTLQAFFHMAANLGLIPLTGIPLPFVTYGGSGTIAVMVGIAVLLNISRFQVVEKKNT